MTVSQEYAYHPDKRLKVGIVLRQWHSEIVVTQSYSTHRNSHHPSSTVSHPMPQHHWHRSILTWAGWALEEEDTGDNGQDRVHIDTDNQTQQHRDIIKQNVTKIAELVYLLCLTKNTSPLSSPPVWMSSWFLQVFLSWSKTPQVLHCTFTLSW